MGNLGVYGEFWMLFGQSIHKLYKRRNRNSRTKRNAASFCGVSTM
jgi:hypothetical protein